MRYVDDTQALFSILYLKTNYKFKHLLFRSRLKSLLNYMVLLIFGLYL